MAQIAHMRCGAEVISAGDPGELFASHHGRQRRQSRGVITSPDHAGTKGDYGHGIAAAFQCDPFGFGLAGGVGPRMT